MTAKTIELHTGFKKCAVCKIDLKGRFVYVDDEIENLLGITREELFGKSIVDFVDEHSAASIEQMLTKRNHYETYYDSTRLTIIGADKDLIVTDAIISLNFIAGNPVNFQLIINKSQSAYFPSVQAVQPVQIDDILEELFIKNKYTDLRLLSERLKRLSSAAVLAVYDITESKIIPVTGCVESGNGFSFDTIPPLTDLHYEIYETENDYLYIDKNDVRKAVEKFNEAPDEFVTVKLFPDNSKYMFRFIYGEKRDANSLSPLIRQVKLLLDVISRINSTPEPAEQFNENPDVKFTIGFLETLDIGAVLIDEKGEIAGYNPTFINLFVDEKLDGKYDIILNKLRGCNESNIIDEIDKYLKLRLDENFQEDLQVDVICPSEEERRLTIIRFSVDPSDHGGCFVFMPLASHKPLKISLFDNTAYNHSVGEYSDSVRYLVSSIKNLSEDLTHHHNKKLDSKAMSTLEKMNDCIGMLHEASSRFDKLLQLKHNVSEKEIIDLNLLIREVVLSLRNSYPGKEADVNIAQLPKITAPKEIVCQVFENILENSFKYSSKSKISIDIESRIVDGYCSIIIKDDGPGISPNKSTHIFDITSGLLTDEDNEQIPICNNLTMSRILMKEIKGDIELINTGQNGTAFQISVPV